MIPRKQLKRPTRMRGIPILLVLAMVGAACSGSTSDESTTTVAGTSATTEGATATTEGATATTEGATATTEAAGGVLGEVIAEYPTLLEDPDWVVWDESACAYVPAEAPYDGPYKVLVRGPGSETPRIGWTPQDEVTDNLVLANSTFDKTAEETGTDLVVVSNEYPSAERPIIAANDMITLAPDVIISMNVFGDLQPAIFELYTEACIPSMAFSVPPPEGIPFIAGSWEDAGRIAGEGSIARAFDLGWAPEEIFVLFCVAGALGTASGGPYDATFTYEDAVFAQGVSADRTQRIDCSQGTGAATPETIQTTTRDWLTAHPDENHVLMFAGPDIRTIGMFNAAEEAGRLDEAVFSGIGLIEAVRALLLEGEPAWAGSIDFGLSTFGPYGIGVAQDVYLGNPVPTRIVQEIQFVTEDTIEAVIESRSGG